MIFRSYNQRGQSMVAMSVTLMAFLLSMTAVIYRFQTVVKEEKWVDKTREISLNVAQAGFNDAVNWFQKSKMAGKIPDNSASFALTSTCLGASDSNRFHYPDAAFLPVYSPITSSSDTDSPGNVGQWDWDSFGNTLAEAIIREVPLHYMGATNFTNTLWGRYVVKRQRVRNWSGCGNTLSAFTDNENAGETGQAVHDISDQKNFATGQAVMFSVQSTAYVYENVTNLVMLNDIHAFQGSTKNPNGDVLYPPVKYYNGHPLLLSTASYYGELVSTAYNQAPLAALWVTDGSVVSMVAPATLGGEKNSAGVYTAAAVTQDASGSSHNIKQSATSPYVNNFDGQYLITTVNPTVGGTFPGFAKSDLANLAEKINSPGSYGASLFPDACQSESAFVAAASLGTTYYIYGPLSFTAGACPNYQLNGIGLLFVDGDLIVNANTNASWSGLIWVNGNCTLYGPCQIVGKIICTGNVKLIGSAGNQVQVTYSQAAIDYAANFFQGFRTNKASILWSAH